MMILRPRQLPRMSSLSLLVTTACLLGCRDNPASARPPEPGVTGGGRFVATVVCAVDVKERRTACELASGGATEDDAGARFLVIRDAQAMVQTGEDAYTPADSTYRLNLRIINNGPSDLGTRDGTAVTGIKAFIPVNIMGYAGRPPGDTTRPGAFLIRPMPNQNQLVHARNPDGRMAFTGPDQPYWSYAQKLAPGETSQWREWRFTVDPSVSHFYFAVSVFAAAPGEPAVPETAPNGWLIPMDSVDVLYSLENTIVEHPRMSGPYPRNIVLLYFRPGSTMDERQAALESVNATVIGGDGFFYLAQLKDDGREELLWRALDRLATFPQIELADPDVRGNIGPTYAVLRAVPGEPAVPETAPHGWLIPMDSVDVLYSLENTIVEHPRMSGPYPRSVVRIFFRPGTTTDEKQAALEWINATVIGGDGLFYHAVLNDGGGEEALWRAVDRLESLPHVEYANPDIRAGVGPA